MTNSNISKYTLIKVLILAHPFYDWLEENINNISYELLEGFITNIIPLGDEGRKFFKTIANKRTGSTNELLNLYNQLEKMYHEGNLKIKSYLELEYLGYAGVSLFEQYPVDDVLKRI